MQAAFPLRTLAFLTIFCAAQPVFVDAADAAAPGQLRPAVLRCEALTDPLGLGETAPRLSWIGDSARRAETQSAYQVLVAATPEALAKDQGDLWDSGKVNSPESAHVAYAGKGLASRAACFWKVRLWDRDGTPLRLERTRPLDRSDCSPRQDWQAKWIDTTQGNSPDIAVPPVEIKHARVLRP